MDKTCVLCGKTTDLNTSMRIKQSSGIFAEVWISDDCVDIATPKKIQEAYTKRREELDSKHAQLKAMAAELGFKLQPESDMQINRPPTLGASGQTQTEAVPAPSIPVLPSHTPGNKIVSGKAADRACDVAVVNNSAAQQVGGILPQYTIASESKASCDLRGEETAEIGIVKGRGGLDIAIPVKRMNPKIGNTEVVVDGKFNDTALQSRFKNQARAGESGQFNYNNGYDIQSRQCPLCKGKGAMYGKMCPKCKGVGDITVSII